MPTEHNAVPLPVRIETLARGVLLMGDRVLLCRNVQGGYRYLPGGHVEPGESAATALAREFHEETGVGVAVGPLLLASEHGFVQGGRRKHEINLTFAVSMPENRGDLAVVWPSLESEIAFDWVRLSDLATADLRPASIAAWLARRVTSGDGGAAGDGCGWFGEGLA